MPEEGPLPPPRRALVELSAALAARDPERLETALLAAAAQADPACVDEVLLQSHLFVGFPIALEAFRRWRELSGTRAPEVDAEEAEGPWEERGARALGTVYGSSAATLRQRVRALHPALDRWMVAGGYGRVLGRPGLDLATRELCVVALLAGWDAPRQLRSHLRGALNAGSPPGEVEEAVRIAAARLPAGRRRDELFEIWRTVRDDTTGAGDGNG